MSSPECSNCKAVTNLNLELVVSKPSTETVATLPPADFLMVTWTDAETEAMATVFGAGEYHFDGAENNNFTPLLLAGLTLPSDEKVHAHFFQTRVNGKTVICLKSEFHPKVQTAATTTFFQKIVGTGETPQFKYVITSGTAGGIWSSLDVGDVVVTNQARYGLTMTTAKQALLFTGLDDIAGTPSPSGADWYDYVNQSILATDTCVNAGLLASGGRKSTSSKPAIYYQATGANLTDVVTNSRVDDDEYGRIAFYRTIGGTLDENDAYVAEALKAVGFTSWVSIRNVSDLPAPTNNDSQYETFGLCSSLNGAYAVWAFVMGHA